MSFSEIESTGRKAPEDPVLNQWQRIESAFFAPSKIFAEIKQGRASWWMPFLITSLTAYLFFAAVVFKIGLPQIVENQNRFNPIAEEKMAQMPPEQRNSFSQNMIKVTFIATPVLSLAGVAMGSLGLWGTINFVFGGRAKYESIFAVWFYASLPSILKMLLGVAVLFAGIAPESFNLRNFAPTNLGAFLDPIDTNKALYLLASSLDVITIWTMLLLGLGTSIVAGVKRSAGYLAVFGWWAIFVLCGVGFAAVFG
jgi:hypothetical protein